MSQQQFKTEVINVRFKPMGDQVLILPDPAEKMKGQIHLPDSSIRNPFRGTVMTFGDGDKISPAYDKMVVEKGDRVVYGEYSGTPLVIEGVSYTLMRQGDLLGTLLPLEDGQFPIAHIPKFNANGADGKIDQGKLNEQYNQAAGGDVKELESVVGRTASGIITDPKA